MNTWDKGPTSLLGQDEGQSFWQPQPTGGWATLKITPRNLRQNAIACITQMVPPGGVIPRHARAAAETVIYVTGGRCTATVDATAHRLEADSTIVVGRQVPLHIIKTPTRTCSSSSG
jgi:quercetin dioxygenase-like cupin family protein